MFRTGSEGMFDTIDQILRQLSAGEDSRAEFKHRPGRDQARPLRPPEIAGTPLGGRSAQLWQRPHRGAGIRLHRGGLLRGNPPFFRQGRKRQQRDRDSFPPSFPSRSWWPAAIPGTDRPPAPPEPWTAARESATSSTTSSPSSVLRTTREPSIQLGHLPDTAASPRFEPSAKEPTKRVNGNSSSGKCKVCFTKCIV